MRIRRTDDSSVRLRGGGTDDARRVFKDRRRGRLYERGFDDGRRGVHGRGDRGRGVAEDGADVGGQVVEHYRRCLVPRFIG